MNKRTLALSMAVMALVILLAVGVGAAAQPLPTQMTPAVPEKPILESAPELTEPAGAEAALALATTRVSISSAGVEGNNESLFPALSNDGRYVAFSSDASNLVANDTNSVEDVFIHDRQTGQTQRISVSAGGQQGNGESWSPAISSTGRYVAFSSFASNLVSGDTNNASDIFVIDRDTGVIQRVSVSSSEAQAIGGSHDPVISDNGRYIAFYSSASDLVAGDTNSKFDVFVRDIIAGETWRVSISTDGTQGNHDSWGKVSISSDGRRVAFSSWANTLVSNDTNGVMDVFVRDWFSGWTTIASISSGGTISNGNSSGMISGNGRYMVFGSDASNLVSGDTNGVSDAFVHDLDTGLTERVSISSNGGQSNGRVYSVDISPGGRLVIFHSAANNLVSNDTNGRQDVFVHDRNYDRTSRVSIATNGTQGNDHAQYLFDMSGDTRFVAFGSYASNLITGDGNGVVDVFVREFRSCYALTLQKQSGQGDPPQAALLQSIGCEPGTYQPGEQITVTANPADGWHVTGWNGTNNDGSTALTNVVTMPTNDHTVSVSYAADCYTLTRNISPSGSGTITPSLLKSASCPANYQYTAGTSVSLQATANSGYQFSSWSGALGGATNPQSVTMDGNKSVTANFSPVCYTLMVSIDPSGTGIGTITLNPSKSAGCPASSQYTYGEVVSLTAMSSSGHTFSHWSGSLSGPQNPKNLTVDGPESVTAHFTANCYTLTRTVSPSGSGTITPNPPKSPSCSANDQYTYDTIVALTATANGDYVFSHWSGSLSGSQYLKNLTVDGNESVTANFIVPIENCYQLLVDHTGNGGDPFTLPSQSTGCSANFYRSGTIVQLTADPANGWHVAGWSGTDNDSSTDTTNTVTMPAGQHTVTVMYEQNSTATGRAYLPSVVHVPSTCWNGPWEVEPNNNAGQANGPICPARTYQGIPDRYDVFYIDIAQNGESFLVELLNYPDPDIQLQVHYQQITSNPIGFDSDDSNGYTIDLQYMPAGRYYIAIANPNPSSTSLYSLRVVLTTSCFGGPLEREPNNIEAEATGPLCPGRDYIGGHTDRYDVFSLNAAFGTIIVELDNYTGVGVQLQLHYERVTSNPVGYDARGDDGYRIELANQPAGTYYVRIVDPNSPTTIAYTIRVYFSPAE